MAAGVCRSVLRFEVRTARSGGTACAVSWASRQPVVPCPVTSPVSAGSSLAQQLGLRGVRNPSLLSKVRGVELS